MTTLLKTKHGKFNVVAALWWITFFAQFTVFMVGFLVKTNEETNLGDIFFEAVTTITTRDPGTQCF